MANSFQGFPKETFAFLEQLANNNNREWFNANKTRYKSVVVAPVMDFINAIRPGLQAVSPYYVADSRPHGGSMFRIYKDTRFSRDKRPYKEHVGCQFRHSAGKDAHAKQDEQPEQGLKLLKIFFSFVSPYLSVKLMFN